MQEQLQYSTIQKKSRALVPKVLILILLGSIFYIGILVNLTLLNLEKTETGVIKWISLTLIIVIIGIGMLLAARHASQPYKFYQTYLTVKNKQLFYTDILDSTPRRDVFDKMFKTYSIHVGRKMFLRHIPTNVPLQTYIQQLVSYAHKSY